MFSQITYRLVFLGFLSSIVLSFFLIRPLNSPWHRFIAGDGFGYYAYLPATYLYNDGAFEFKWFNKVYAQEYLSDGSASADQHFLVAYKGKMVNKYYPGLSLLWLPFFALAHVCALVFQFPANGFSLPYQWGIGSASLFYLFLGLFYLRKLIFKFSGKAWIALLVPVLIFYGTYLFDYAINMNSLSHVYSFSMVTIFSYYAFKFLNDEENQWYHFSLAIFFLALLVSIRPLNVLVLALIPALAHKKNPLFGHENRKPGFSGVIILFFALCTVIWQFYILYTSTNDFFPNTYQEEEFHFTNPMWLKAAFGYQYGMFLYAPILLFALFSAFYYPGKYKKWILPLYFIFLHYLYASWWYWPISSRALIDFYVIPALLLATFLSRINKRRYVILSTVFLALFVGYYQLKHLQFRRGVLDKNYTHRQLFWGNFFKYKTTQQFVVPPASIIRQSVLYENFENVESNTAISNLKAYSGKHATFLDAQNEYSPEFTSIVPEFLQEKGLAKIRYSVQVLIEEDMREFQVYINFFDPQGQQTLSLPFYAKEETLKRGQWTEIQFGYEFNLSELERINNSKIQLFIWNSGKKNRLYIDDAKLEFFLCDRSAEIVP